MHPTRRKFVKVPKVGRAAQVYIFTVLGWLLFTASIARDWRWWVGSAGLLFWVHAGLAFYLLTRKGEASPE